MAARLTSLRHLCMHGFSAVEENCKSVMSALARLPALVDWDLKDAETLDIRPIGGATALTRLVLSGYTIPPQREVR